jgi:DNA-binding NarL/FixJ family response regulator
MVRQGLRVLLETEPDLEVVGEANDGAEAIDRVDDRRPDVVLMDLLMPRLDGITATQRLQERHPEVRVVLLSSDEAEAAVVAAVRAGAIGVVSKAASIDVLVDAIRAAADGRVTLSAAISARLVHELRAPAEQPERLTGRELEVLGRVVDGLSNKEIAWALRISEKTVKSHVSTILGKFGLESRTQAALHATRTGLVPVPAAPVISLDSRRQRPFAVLA